LPNNGLGDDDRASLRFDGSNVLTNRMVFGLGGEDRSRAVFLFMLCGLGQMLDSVRYVTLNWLVDERMSMDRDRERYTDVGYGYKLLMVRVGWDAYNKLNDETLMLVLDRSMDLRCCVWVYYRGGDGEFGIDYPNSFQYMKLARYVPIKMGLETSGESLAVSEVKLPNGGCKVRIPDGLSLSSSVLEPRGSLVSRGHKHRIPDGVDF